MSLLLDTTVLVDLGRGHAPTRSWLAAQAIGDLYLASITVGELVCGAYRRNPAGTEGLARELSVIEDGILAKFHGRILPFDLPVAWLWGRIVGRGEARGRRPTPDDAKIAAIALHHGLTVATSNTRQFAGMVPTVDPRTA